MTEVVIFSALTEYVYGLENNERFVKTVRAAGRGDKEAPVLHACQRHHGPQRASLYAVSLNAESPSTTS